MYIHLLFVRNTMLYGHTILYDILLNDIFDIYIIYTYASCLFPRVNGHP